MLIDVTARKICLVEVGYIATRVVFLPNGIEAPASSTLRWLGCLTSVVLQEWETASGPAALSKFQIKTKSLHPRCTPQFPLDLNAGRLRFLGGSGFA